MIRLHFQEPQTPAWASWRQKVQAEIAALANAGPPYSVKDDLYKEQRETIFACYLNKCAYCEGQYKLTANEGDVEHYRPKGRVRDRENHIVKVVWAGAQVNHPGYWWLAYEAINLLPSCSFCNRTGKRDLFPLEPGSTYALQPGEERDEKPLLVHPGLENPDDHLKYDPVQGVLVPKSEKGSFSIETFGLNREDLLTARKNTYRNVVASIMTASSLQSGALIDIPGLLADLRKYKTGEAAYSLVGRAALSACREPVEQLIERMKSIFD